MSVEIILEKTLAITGHRPKKLPWANEKEKLCRDFKACLKDNILQMMDKGCDTF